MKEIILYTDKTGKIPFLDFFSKLDNTYKVIIQKRLRRIEKKEHFGKTKSLKEGIFELKFDNGIRIYYGQDGDILVLILFGSGKDDQQKGIKKAKAYWQEYNKEVR
ncbi:MAG: type II toxin-antitoxin system RelE/ParE family toxin [bacterium]|nr:type II toxin-antitoxin system RelE/ParE family toxin [bacterium]